MSDLAGTSKLAVYLSGRCLSLGSVWLLVGTFGAFFPELLVLYAGLGGLFAVVLFLDRRSCADVADVTVEIEGPRQLELNQEGEVTIRFSRPLVGAQVLRKVRLECRLPRELERRGNPDFRGAGCVTLGIKAVRLGLPQISELRLRIESPLGLWLCERVIRFPALTVHVAPSLAVMPEREYHLLCSRHPLLYQGIHQLTRHASPDIYLTSRAYQYGDPLRFIDYRKSARFGGVFTKEFESLHEHHLVVVLDIGRAMAGTVNGSPKSEYYRSAAMNVMRLAVRMGDSVSFVAFADSVIHALPRSRTHSHVSAVGHSAELVVRDVASDFTQLQGVLARVAPQRAIVVILTDAGLPSIQDQVQTFTPRLGRKHLCLVVSMIDSEFDTERALIKASKATSTGALGGDEYLELLYRYWVHDSMASVSQSLSRAGAELILIPEEYWLDTCARIYRQLRHSLGA